MRARSILSVSGVSRVLRLERHRPAGRGDDQRAGALDREGFRRAGRRRRVEDADGLSAGEVDAAPLDLGAELPEALIAREQQRLQPGSIAVA